MGVGAIYDKIKRVIYTEKSSKDLEGGKYHFEITKDCTKQDVKEFVEKTFGVDVVKVNIMITKGKAKRFKGRLGRRGDCKKAIITVKEGQSIKIDKVS